MLWIAGPAVCGKLLRTASGERSVVQRVNAHPAVALATLCAKFFAGHGGQLVEGLAERLAEQAGGLVRVQVRAALRLRDDLVDHAQLEAVHRVRA